MLGKAPVRGPEQSSITATDGWIGVHSDQGVRDRMLVSARVDLSSLRHHRGSAPHLSSGSVEH
jgi:hypothetical protein